MKFSDLPKGFDLSTLSPDELEDLMSPESLMMVEAMKLAEVGKRMVREIVEHVADGFEKGIEPEFMAKASLEKMFEGPSTAPAIMLLGCIMDASHTLYHLREDARIAKTN